MRHRGPNKTIYGAISNRRPNQVYSRVCPKTNTQHCTAFLNLLADQFHNQPRRGHRRRAAVIADRRIASNKDRSSSEDEWEPIVVSVDAPEISSVLAVNHC
jgi:hypothetical protein